MSLNKSADVLSIVSSENGSDITTGIRFPKIALAKPRTPNVYFPPDFPVQMGKAALTPRETKGKAPTKVLKLPRVWHVNGNERNRVYARVNRWDKRSIYNNDPKRYEIPPEFLHPKRRRSTLPTLPKIQLNPNEPHDEEESSPGPINNAMFIQSMNKPTKLAKALKKKKSGEMKRELSPISASVASLTDRRVSVFDIPVPFRAKRCNRPGHFSTDYCEILGPTACSCCIEKTNKDTAGKIQAAHLIKPPEVTANSLVAPFLSFTLTQDMFSERLRTAEQVSYVEHLQRTRYNTPKVNRLQKFRPFNIMSPGSNLNIFRNDTIETFSSDSVGDSVLGMSDLYQDIPMRRTSRRESKVSFDNHPPTEYIFVPWD